MELADFDIDSSTDDFNLSNSIASTLERDDRPFYADLSFDSEESDSCYDFLPTRGMNTDQYVLMLLHHLKMEPHYGTYVKLLCQDGIVNIPLLATALGCKSLVKPISDIYLSDTDIIITIPCTVDTAKLFKEILLTGTSLSLSQKDNHIDLSLFEELGFVFDTEEISIETNSEDGTIIPDEFSSDDDREDDFQIDLIEEDTGLVKDQTFFCKNTSTVKSLCAPSCLNNCSSVENKWKSEDIQEVKNIFKGATGFQLKNKLVNYLSVQSVIGKVVNGYIIHGHEFCMEYFSHLTGCRMSTLRSVLSDFFHGVRLYEYNNRGIIRNPTTATMNFTVWFKNTLSLIGQSAPDDEVIVVNYWMKPKVLYSLYVNDAPKPHIALKTFYHHLKSIFGPKRIDKTLPCVRRSEYSSHSVCDECSAINKYQKLCRTEAQMEMVKALRNDHKLSFGGARREVETLRQSAIDFPEDTLFLQVDGMGNWSSYIPRYYENSKNLAGTIRLTTKVTGCIIWSGLYEEKRKDIFFINHDQFGR